VRWTSADLTALTCHPKNHGIKVAQYKWLPGEANQKAVHDDGAHVEALNLGGGGAVEGGLLAKDGLQNVLATAWRPSYVRSTRLIGWTHKTKWPRTALTNQVPAAGKKCRDDSY
jgi:hypothetical protein